MVPNRAEFLLLTDCLSFTLGGADKNAVVFNKENEQVIRQVFTFILCLFNPFQPSAAFLVETSHLFCSAKQVTGFCMKRNNGLKLVSKVLWSLPKIDYF